MESSGGGIPLRLTLTLTADGKYTLVSESDGPVGNAYGQGTYTYSGRTMIGYKETAGGSERAVITWLNKNEFRCAAAAGLHITYTRAP